MKAQQPSGRPTKAAASRRAADDPATRRPGTAPRKGPKTDTQRGEDPKETVPPVTGEPPQWRDPSPGWRPDPRRARHLTEVIDEIGGDRRRPRREDVYPYLLIRAVVGDRGVRPTWPPVPCWESPDVLLIDASYTGAFDPARLVVSPVAGRSYRVFVRIWNLGLLPAVGVLVRAWAVNPGFFGTGNQDDPYYRQHLIGGTWAELSDRTRPDSVAVVELDTPWTPDAADIGHHCLLAEVGSPLDPAGGFLLSNVDRHVGQRNLTVLTGGQSPQPLIAQLGTLVPQGFALEVTHAGVDALPALHCWQLRPDSLPFRPVGLALDPTLKRIAVLRARQLERDQAVYLGQYIFADDRRPLRNQPRDQAFHPPPPANLLHPALQHRL